MEWSRACVQSEAKICVPHNAEFSCRPRITNCEALTADRLLQLLESEMHPGGQLQRDVRCPLGCDWPLVVQTQRSFDFLDEAPHEVGRSVQYGVDRFGFDFEAICVTDEMSKAQEAFQFLHRVRGEDAKFL